MFGKLLRACHRSSHVLSVGGALFLLCMICCRVEASGRATEIQGKAATSRAPASREVIADSDQPLAFAYYVGHNKTGLSLTGKYTSFDFKVLKDSDAKVKPDEFVKMWGTRDGMAALAQALADMLAGEQVKMRRMDASTMPSGGPVDAAAIFAGDKATHLVTVRFADGKAVFEVFAVEEAGCTATPLGGSCSCTASGPGSYSCTSGTNPSTGINWAKCTDSTGTTNCTWNGTLCGCSGAAQ